MPFDGDGRERRYHGHLYSSGQLLRGVGEAVMEQDIAGRPMTLEPGDVGQVLFRDAVELVVQFEPLGTFCADVSDVEPIDGPD